MGEVSVSAVVPLYNGAEFIAEALDSIMRQSEPPAEIIVVNDGSSDDGPAIVEKIAASQGALPLVLLHKENGGQSSARNLGVNRCKGTHVAFLDQDDIWYEDHIEVLSSELKTSDKRKQPALIYGNLDQIDRAGRMVNRRCLDDLPGPHPKTSRSQYLRDDMFIVPSASLVSVAAFLAAGGFDERLSGYEDDDLFLRMFTAGYESVYVDKSVTRWRIHSASSSYSPRMAASRMVYYKKLTEDFQDDPDRAQFWLRDLVAPRFFRQTCLEFILATRQRNYDASLCAWQNVIEVADGMPKRVVRHIRGASSIIRSLIELKRFRLARFIFRRAMR